MIDRGAARDVARKHAPEGLQVEDTLAQELRTGWFFPYRTIDPDDQHFGTNGVIVNKETGATLQLGSAFPIERDLVLYDKGYQFELYDLVVTAVADLEGTLDTLQGLGISAVEPTYRQSTVWRIPRAVTREELRVRLARLPHVFGELRLYFRVEVLERAREAGAFQFQLLQCPDRPAH